MEGDTNTMPDNAEIMAAISGLQATYSAGQKALADDLTEIKQALRDQNGRIRDVEIGEAGCPARGANLPDRVGKLENEIAEARGAARSGQIGGVAGGIAIITQLVQIIASLILGGGTK